MARIIEVRALQDYRLFVRFDDGREGEGDLSDLPGKGVFAQWTDLALFMEATVDTESGTVCWPCGIDLCPDVLYHDITGAPLPGERVESV